MGEAYKRRYVLVLGPDVNRVRDEYLDCVFFVYSSPHDAEQGEHSGGSGFLAHVQLENNSERCMIYAVTNSHVIKKCGDRPAITVNRKEGKREVFATNSPAPEFKPEPTPAPAPEFIPAVPLPVKAPSAEEQKAIRELSVDERFSPGAVGARVAAIEKEAAAMRASRDHRI
jgi:hypothetical protein